MTGTSTAAGVNPGGTASSSTAFNWRGPARRRRSQLKVAGGQTTVYVGPHYEKNLTTGVVTKYYYLGGQRVAMVQGGTRYYLHADHGFADEAWAARAW
ncbi:MAG TPA: hypothetical protein PKH27_14475 [Candidatus Desulfobacillus denitrificans]|nr:hypothetical protein [Candidatus Desulfobacillus denitrificans]